MRFAYLESLPSILSNPSHLLTIFCSFILLVIPLLSVHMSAWLDRALALSMSLCMIAIGIRLVKSLGSMLLMSYGGSGVTEVVREIENDAAVTGVEEARFWQVHHGLCMANLKLNVSTSNMGESSESRIRERIVRLVRDRLGGGYGKGAQQTWEVSVALHAVG
jgi:Co/Zn/Cd efflux system component